MKNERHMKKARAAVFAVGHSNYWPQFPQLKNILLGLHKEFCNRISEYGVEVIDYGILDESTRAFDVAKKIFVDVDIVFCNMVTYATSSVFAPIIRAKSAPVILVALQPMQVLDYNSASTYMQLQNDNICSVPEFIGVASRFNQKIDDVILGCLYNDKKAEAELYEWCSIAKVIRSIRGARIGLMGHVLEAMYDMHTDPTTISATFGLHVPLLEIDSLLEIRNNVSESEIRKKAKEITEKFDTPNPANDPITSKLTEKDLYNAAKSAVALEKFVEQNDLTGLAYYYEGIHGSPTRLLAETLIVGNSLLIAEGIPMCGEFDIKTCLAMLIMDRLGIGGSFAELHPFDFSDDCILIGHDGPHHIDIADGKPILRSLSKYHGKPGSGASVEFKIKEGPITMLGITQKSDGKFKFVIGEGMSKRGPVPPTGNTNTRASFEPDTKAFVKRWVMEGPTHHYALGIGHYAKTIKKIADVFNIESVIVN